MTRLLGIEQIMFDPSSLAFALGPAQGGGAPLLAPPRAGCSAVDGSKRVEPVRLESDEF
jgi:hypothetical protein